tara:strand:- start:39 stop:473 length:435 start_codon:yes stop_codon:yes gene_type:complete
MSIDKDIKVTINLNKIVEERLTKMMGYINFGDKVIDGTLISTDDIDEIAVNARSSVDLNPLFDSVDLLICNHLGIEKPSVNDMVYGVHYGEIQPEPGREAYLTKLESEAKKRKAYFEKNFELKVLEGGSWTIEVPVRKEKILWK